MEIVEAKDNDLSRWPFNETFMCGRLVDDPPGCGTTFKITARKDFKRVKFGGTGAHAICPQCGRKVLLTRNVAARDL